MNHLTQKQCEPHLIVAIAAAVVIFQQAPAARSSDGTHLALTAAKAAAMSVNYGMTGKRAAMLGAKAIVITTLLPHCEDIGKIYDCGDRAAAAAMIGMTAAKDGINETVRCAQSDDTFGDKLLADIINTVRETIEEFNELAQAA